MKLVKSGGPLRTDPQALNFFFGRLKFKRPSQNQTQFNHVGGMRNTVVRPQLHDLQIQTRAIFIIERDDGRVSTEPCQLLNEVQSGFL